MFENVVDNTNWERIDFNYFQLKSELKTVPTTPGVYFISTNTPEEILRSCEKREDPKHYNLSKKVNESRQLPDECKIMQNGDNPYVVYSGHSYRLRQRASEHFKGANGTGCLAIFKLKDLRNYNWSFHFLETSFLLPESKTDSSLFRTFLEQKLRSVIGWPILCSQ